MSKSPKKAAAPKSAAKSVAVAPVVAPKPVAERKSFPEDARITVIATANPKRPGTKAFTKWGFYAKSKTVGQFVAAMIAAKYPRRRAMSALRWDSGHGFIKIG